MALRSEELGFGPDAAVLAFPTALVRARARRRARVLMIRRRVVSLSVVMVVMAGVLLSGGVGNSTPTSIPGAPHRVTIRAGTTLWDVAERYAPATIDPRVYVDALIELNELSGPLPVGTRLKLPR
jgi:hypothetical protein